MAQVLTLVQDLTTREQWLKARRNMIGGSDASAILGLNPYKTNIEVWQEKTGRVIPEDKDNPFMEYGRNAEKHLIALFALDHPQYKVTANPNYEVIYHPKHSFVAGTLDGYLAEKETGRKGVLEIKTTEILNSMHREKWNDKVPDNYYIQVLHYLLSTGWDFAVLKAQLKTVYGDDVRLNTRHYHIERSEVQEDLDYLLEKEIKFWRYVEKDKKPPLVLPPI